jgi:dCMP deaminase
MESDWAKRFMNLAKEACDWSKDPSTQHGAVIVDSDHNIRAIGCNGFPRKIVDSPARFADRAVKLKIVVHAEVNACVSCARTGVSALNTTLYVTAQPCAPCASVMIQAGIIKVVINRDDEDAAFNERWADDIALARQILKEAGVQTVDYHDR